MSSGDGKRAARNISKGHASAAPLATLTTEQNNMGGIRLSVLPPIPLIYNNVVFGNILHTMYERQMVMWDALKQLGVVEDE